MSYYQSHVFFCLNEREAGLQCCMGSGAQNLFDYAKAQIKALNLNGPGKIRINKAGCLDRCAFGPVLVIYPEGIWYQCKTMADVDEIISQHLQLGQVVTRLKLG